MVGCGTLRKPDRLPPLCPNFAQTIQWNANGPKRKQAKQGSVSYSGYSLKPCFQRTSVSLFLVGSRTLDLAILVRVQASQPNLFPLVRLAGLEKR